MDEALRKVLKKVPKKKNKYGAKKAGSLLFEGRMFDSKAERDRAEQLKVMERDGDIQELELQPQTSLSKAEIGYKPDFAYTENGVRIYEDVKGVETEGFRIKARLWKKYGYGPLRITKRKGIKSPFTISKTIYVD
tara:strand:+ start:5115 stop:5519 length:405 start_codon:yes stop_codon:yes gene_type:complete